MTDIANPEQPTADEITRHYNAAMDSVNLLNAGQPEGMTNQEWADCIQRNVDHLKIMVAKTWWAGTSHDLTPLNAAIDAHK